MKDAQSLTERRRRYRFGWRGERFGELYLGAKGYRVVARRVRTPVGEIDLIVTRGRRISFVEVKSRASFALAESSVSARQRVRVRKAAQAFLATHTGYAAHEQTFDLLFVVPWRWPRHLVNAL